MEARRATKVAHSSKLIAINKTREEKGRKCGDQLSVNSN
jgi:hypothetical protein